jgi:hypothetical protein
VPLISLCAVATGVREITLLRFGFTGVNDFSFFLFGSTRGVVHFCFEFELSLIFFTSDFTSDLPFYRRRTEDLLFEFILAWSSWLGLTDTLVALPVEDFFGFLAVLQDFGTDLVLDLDFLFDYAIFCS